MTYALDSSKRKFHRLLESISNNESTTSLAATARKADASTSSLTAEPSGKKRRVSVLRNPQQNALTQKSNVDSASSVSHLTTSTTSITSTTTQTPAFANVRLADMSLEHKFCPGDRDQLLKRIESFFSMSVLEWRIKPDLINEVEWAKRGWQLVGKEEVACVSCKKQMVIPYEGMEGSEAYFPTSTTNLQEVFERADAAERLQMQCKGLIVSAHDDSCPWKTCGCSDTLYRLPMRLPVQQLGSLHARYEAVCKITEKLPREYELELLKDIDISALMYQFHALRFRSPSSPELPELPDVKHRKLVPDEVRKLAFVLALFGWDQDGRRPDTLRCEACFRRLGMWMYFATDWDLEGRPLPAPTMVLQPDRDHYSHCPWINRKTQSMAWLEEDQVAAWEAVSRTIKNGFESKGRSSEADAASYTTADYSSSAPASRLHSNLEQDQGSGLSLLSGTSEGSLDTGFEATEDGVNEEAREKKHEERLSRLEKVKKMFDFKRKKH